MLVRAVSYQTVADSTTPIYQAVRNSNNDVIVAAFNVEAYGPDSAAVIEVSKLYTAPPPELSPGAQFRGAPDPNRSFIERVLSFPTNVEVEATLTFPPPPPGGTVSPGPRYEPPWAEAESERLRLPAARKAPIKSFFMGRSRVLGRPQAAG